MIETLIPPQVAARLRQLARLRKQQATNECNGAPHPQVIDPRCLNANASAWGRDEETTRKAIDSLAGQYGIEVSYSGLAPSFSKDGQSFYL